MDYRKLLEYVGDLGQVFGVRPGTLTEGLARGMRTLDVENGSGLSFTVLPDRCLDLAKISFKGVNCGYFSKTGLVAPTYNAKGDNFFRVFTAGALTTCGLRNVGNPSEEGGESFGIHGRVGSIPAENVSAGVEIEDGVPVVKIKGTVRETAFFGENLRLTRTITCRMGENRIHMSNEVENLGFRDEILMILMHCNVGWPLLDPGTRFLAPSLKVEPRDPEAAKGVYSWSDMQEPTPGYAEQVFYHDLATDGEGNTTVAYVNRKAGIGEAITFNRSQFPVFTQWKQMGQGEYVAAMEPGNCFVGGRKDPRNAGRLTVFRPMEKRSFDLTFSLYSGDGELDELEEMINKLIKQ